jgi:hypothetical protein
MGRSPKDFDDAGRRAQDENGLRKIDHGDQSQIAYDLQMGLTGVDDGINSAI